MKRLVMVVMMVIMMASTAYGAQRSFETENSWITINEDFGFANVRAKNNIDDLLIVRYKSNGDIANMTLEHDVYDGIWLVGVEKINFDNGWFTTEYVEYPYHMYYDKDR